MNVLDTILSDTVCCNLVTDKNNGNLYCKFLTNSIGRLHPTNKSFCNLQCRKNGPYNGRILSVDDEKEFIISSLKKYNPFFIIDDKFISRVLNIYKLPVDIIMPIEYDDILDNLKFLYDVVGFNDILLTGSMITGNANRPLKDYDIVLWFNNLEDYINDKVKDNLPKSINGVKADYFIIIGDKDISLSSLFFCTISPKNKILYKSKWFELNLQSTPDNFTIVESKCEYFDIIMKEKFLTDHRP